MHLCVSVTVSIGIKQVYVQFSYLVDFGPRYGRDGFLAVRQITLLKELFYTLLRYLHTNHWVAHVCQPETHTRSGKKLRSLRNCLNYTLSFHGNGNGDWKCKHHAWPLLFKQSSIFIPLHINCFPAEREEEANSGTASKNFVDISLQHPVGDIKRKTSGPKLWNIFRLLSWEQVNS